MTNKDDDYQKKQREWEVIKKEFQHELWKRAEVIKKFDVTTIKPTNVTLYLEDNESVIKKFKLISIMGRGGVLGHQLSIKKEYVDSLMKKYKKSYPFISKIEFYDKPYFPYSDESDVIKFSPLFILVYNTNYIENKLDPYNVEMAGFLLNYFPFHGIFLEAVSKSVAGTISVIENLMKRNNEPYSRKNHLLNWLYYIISRDSRSLQVRIFNMQKKYMLDFSDYLNSLKK
ncbi:MAG: hypothetical protein ACTSPY_10135 [Candidatus Helarchaeota archaeon]